ncbi:MAG: MogA/MoaB family molybdenum cofactor biosynthesis protein [Bacteroidales bacterium]|jgi:molybdenum cofactor synthesis domain-containing protein
MKLPEKYRTVIITLSDRAYRGEYPDQSGPRVRELTEMFFRSLNSDISVINVLIPDDGEMLKKELIKAAEVSDIIFTTGGTGIGPRDITVETVRPLLTKEIPGIMEFIRVKYGTGNPGALLSCGVAGLINRCLIYTLPGSVKAVNEYMSEITKTLGHTFLMLHGIDKHKG